MLSNLNKIDNIRNFCIIAHIDHGKSTLADRLLEFTGSVSKREMSEQVLDNMEIEKERGITIKARAVTIKYKAKDQKEYILNLIDTPGHVDFSYEVSRSLAACEGAVLIVDATQGVEAQTLSNIYLALDAGLEILPVINKIDLPSAQPDKVLAEIENILGKFDFEIPLISAKMGTNIEEVLELIVNNVPPPKDLSNNKLKALVFDSYYDSYKGVVVYVKIKEGLLKNGSKIKFMSTGAEFTVTECGVMHTNDVEIKDALKCGDVGYVAASIKSVSDAQVGDTITLKEDSANEPLPGYKKVSPMVYCGIYPVDGSKYLDLKESLQKLKLNDSALSFEPEMSVALGSGFRCGFLGLLHMEIIQERLEKEYNLEIITTAPSVIYKIVKTNKEVIYVSNPINYPSPNLISKSLEPIVDAHIYTPKEYVGTVMKLCEERRGISKNLTYIDTERVELLYELPLNEIVYNFFDVLKSRTKGYASLDYEVTGYKESDLVKLDIMLSGEIVDALSFIVHRKKAYENGRKMAEKLKEKIPRQLFEIPIQACVSGKIIARETVKAVRKDVLAKCYGGDITRKKKLLEKQKAGKKRMRRLGNVDVPQDAFMSVLKLDD